MLCQLQVRKYLLRLDVRKEHPKFWRPAIFLSVDEPSHELNLIDFCNDLKKGGLYILGNVMLGKPETLAEVCEDMRLRWLDFIQQANVKAFSEVCVAPTARLGYQNLVYNSGLGGLRPNTVVFPFYVEDQMPGQSAKHSSVYNMASLYEARKRCQSVLNDMEELVLKGRNIMESQHARGGTPQPDKTSWKDEAEYVAICQDVLRWRKNLVLARHFELLDKQQIRAFARRNYGQRNRQAPPPLPNLLDRARRRSGASGAPRAAASGSWCNMSPRAHTRGPHIESHQCQQVAQEEQDDHRHLGDRGRHQPQLGGHAGQSLASPAARLRPLSPRRVADPHAAAGASARTVPPPLPVPRRFAASSPWPPSAPCHAA